MLRRVLAVSLAGWLILSPAALLAQAKPAVDADLAAGIRQAEAGDYAAAIPTLEAAAGRLALNPMKVGELAQAYLHLGAAYAGKGQDAAAKAKFREALHQIRELTLSADKYPARVIRLFESARDEVTAAVPAEEGPGTKAWIFGGLGLAAAGAGVLLARNQGGPDGGGVTQTASGNVGLGQEQSFLTVTSRGSGRLAATLTWTNPMASLSLSCQESDPPYIDCGSRFTRVTATSGTYDALVTAKVYLLVVSNFGGAVEPYTLTVRVP